MRIWPSAWWLRKSTIAASVVDLPLPVAPVTRISPASLDNSSGIARGAPSEESCGQLRGSSRSVTETPLICLKALPRSRWPPVTVEAKSTCPFAHHIPCCSSLSHAFNNAPTSGGGKGAGSSRPNLRQRGGESLHRCRSETLCFTLRATISSTSIDYSSENERHCA